MAALLLDEPKSGSQGYFNKSVFGRRPWNLKPASLHIFKMKLDCFKRKAKRHVRFQRIKCGCVVQFGERRW